MTYRFDPQEHRAGGGRLRHARRALESRGVSNYVPFSVDLLTRAWPQYRAPIETHWLPYLAGKGALEEAIDAVVEAIALRK